ncbi:MAG: peptidase M23 [Betaproteobacteria bacterium HGW-Betaproteobacteria-7]|jgi:lipoprotein NlpD|nr:MAG: peptidase M23 [Betaproteobacteria bacterium HGW-Betaproteobacteria-7]
MIRLFIFGLSALLAGCFSQPPAPAVDRGASAQAATQPSGPGYYTVKRGDTLYRIAMEHGQDYRDVAGWNNIVNPATIKEGQILRVAPPVTVGDATVGVQATPIAVGGGVEVRSLDAPAMAEPSRGLKREPRVGKEPYSDEAYARLGRGAENAPAPTETRIEAKPEPAPAAAAVAPDDVPWIWPSAGKVVAPYSESGNKGLDFAGKAGDPVIAAGDGKVVYAGSGLRGYGELVIIKHNATFLSAYAHNRKILVKEGQQVARGQKIAEMGNSDADSVKLHFEIRKQGKPVDPAQYLPRR